MSSIRLKNSSRVRQRDISDCGAACLASIAAFYQLQLPVARIRQLAATDNKGTNVLGIIEAATKLGFEAKGVKGPWEALFNIPKPAIAHVVIKERLHHFVVIYKVTKTHVVVMDPADGLFHKLTHEAFKAIWTNVLILLMPSEDFRAGNEKISHLQRFWYLLKPHRTVVLQALFGAIVYTILGLSTSIYVQKIVDNVLVEGNKNLLNLLGIIMILILVLQLFIGQLKSVFALKTGQQIDARLILGYYKHLLRLPQQFFDTMRVGEITSRISDAVKIRVFINDIAIGLVVNVFIVIFSFCLMFTYYWKLAIIMLAILPVYGIIYWISNQVNRKMQRKLMEENAELGGQLVESLNSVSTIKRFGLEDYANMKTENRFVKLLKTIFSSSVTNLYIGNAGGFITSAFVVILLWAGSYFVMDRQLSPGELLSFYALIGYFTGPAMSLIGANRSMQDALIAADRLFEIMDLEQEETGNKVTLTPELVGDVAFQNVSFRYGTRVQVFRNFNMQIAKGKITAIVGESGSGKSTLMALMQNLYPLQEGSILIGKMDIRYIDTDSLRKRVSVVPQQIDLFAGTVMENIAVGEVEPDMQRVLQISTQLGIIQFIEKLPDGFNTMLGEHGVNLSGGQRQRVAIARALYRNPEILILDEATSSLDSVSDQYVQDVMQQLRDEGKTIIVIAHRLSTVMNADKIVVLQEGVMAEEGTHSQLLQNNAIYSRLWQHHQAIPL
ncbi:peptidase domain-containing ABC transporter [Chitinophaga niabensis]|uniref:Bacteriocin-processing peptidase. Cysteine peptidase. MEROPS family C39 n=1 Tax=Chitinophaga niabensis TaxID=536979 RepID=A0A1N6EHJ6_9BACT|nr:peptidase domain-containing ABC transporter [Chitinophaga niabensis]SIN82476.1 bacteriocin-processing peptidase. Cysteine peptidase. MEROPS family C39 [Chitinophaga niabensis]